MPRIDTPTVTPAGLTTVGDLSQPPTVYLGKDRTLRVKIIDSCGLACTFCHNEGTPVATDNLNRTPQTMTGDGRSGRVSIYLATNGATFLPATIKADEAFARAIRLLSTALDVDELHLTGGEPTLHPQLADLVQLGRENGYSVCMTSNGENGAKAIPECATAGLNRVNFSVFGTTPTELAEVQGNKYHTRGRPEQKITALINSVEACRQHGIRASANIVVPDRSHAPRVIRLLEEWAPTLSVRLLNSLDAGDASVQAICDILAELNAVHVARYFTAGTSGFRDAYELPDGRSIHFKQIRKLRLPRTCATCHFNNDRDCHEGYHGVRLYLDRTGEFYVGVCLQRMDLCMRLDEFLASALCDEIVAFRQADYHNLCATTPIFMERKV